MRLFKPILAGVQTSDRLMAGLGAALGIGIVVSISALFPALFSDLPLIVAPLGASAVLVFAVPSSPMAQPWPVIGGNTLSALIGVLAYQAIPDFAVAAGVAVGAAILIMSLSRCLHPPGGASALTAVIGSDAIHAAGYGFALAPVALNSICLVGAALLFHRVTRHSYPHRPAPTAAPVPAGLDAADIDAALADMHESFDISREDIDALIRRAEIHAARRR